MGKRPDQLVTNGELAGKTFSVGAGGLRLGRSSSNDIHLGDEGLSRNHCLFEVRDGALWVTDLASANGTIVNDEPLGAESKTLKPGEKPVAEFVLTDGEKAVAVYEYCNLHGLWVKEI